MEQRGRQVEKMMERQLLFEFAEIPKGSGNQPSTSGLAEGNLAWLKSKARKTKSINTAGADPGRLLEEIAAEANLATALLHVVRNKGAPGVDGQTVEAALAKAKQLLPRLRVILLSGKYSPVDVKRIWIPKPGSKDLRGLGVPTVLDRWVQQATHQVLQPIFEPDFHQSSHGFRPKRGARTAMAEARTLVQAGHEWVVSLDLSKFFDRVNHQRLLARLARRVPDKRVLRLIHQMLKAKTVLPDGTKVASEEGTPQGGPLSPILSNIVLDELDWELDRRGLRFVRYADDLNVFVRSERAGARVRERLTRFVEQRLRLKVNEEKTVVERPENVHILGFSIKNLKRGTTEILVSKKTWKRLRNKIRELTPRNWGESLTRCMEKVNEYLQGWMAYFSLCTVQGDLGTADSHIRRRLRAIIVKQKKQNRHLHKHLKTLVSKKAATATAYCGRGPWFKSHTSGIDQAYPNKWFRGKLFSLADKWQQIKRPPIEAVSGQLLLGL
jgi:group II intron reverse transcriptase/maturase